MKQCVACKQTKELASFYRRRKATDGLTSRCKACAWKVTKAARGKDIDKYNLRLRQWKQENKNKVAASQLRWRKRNPEMFKAHRAKWATSNRDKVNASIGRWKQANTHCLAAYQAKRRAARLNATPAWRNDQAITDVYETAARLTRETGIEHHVDHIVPLISPLVCGLHVEQNLMVVTGLQNLSKSNKHWPDMPAQAASGNVFTLAGSYEI